MGSDGGIARAIVAGGPEDRGRVAATLAAAFTDDPVFGWFFPDDARRPACLAQLFARLYDIEMRYGTVVRSPDDAAASFWRAPGGAITPPAALIRHLPALLGLFGLRIGRLAAVSQAIAAHMPQDRRFWYAHFVGVQPDHQRGGWGRAMMQDGIARAVRDQVPIYLETARPANVAFYRTLGFAVTDEWTVRAGPRFWSLMKSPEAVG